MGAGLQRPVMVKIAERCGNDSFRVGSANVNGFRDSNEDAHLLMLRPDGGFFGVFDGHAGVDCANFMRDRFRAKLEGLTFPLAHEQLHKLAVESDAEFLLEKNFSQGGSTGTFFVAIRTKSETEAGVKEMIDMLIGNVGDSRVLLFDGEKCVSLTTDHKPGDSAEKARIEKYGGYTSGNRVDGNLAVSRAFGDRDFKTNQSLNPYEQKVIAVPDVTTATVPWNKGAFAVLCCDGVFESNFSNEQVIEFIRNQLTQTKDLAVIAGRVCHEAVDRGSRDNVTCVVVQFSDGSDYTVEPEVEAIPGPFHSPQHPLFRDLYEKSALACNTSIETVLERRFDELISVPYEQLPSDQQFELHGFLRDGQLPPIGEKSEARTQWFKDYFAWARTAKVEPKTGPAPAPAGLREAQLRYGTLKNSSTADAPQSTASAPDAPKEATAPE